MRIALFVEDLIFQSKIRLAAKNHSAEAIFFGAGFSEEVLSSCDLAIVDLNNKGFGGARIIQEIKTKNSIRVIGFLSHIQKELYDEAESLGCDQIMSRSQFTHELDSLFER